MINIKNEEQAMGLQGFLLNFGYDIGKHGVDGDWGPSSQRALDAFVADVKNPPIEAPTIESGEFDTRDTREALESRIQYIIKGAKEFKFTPKQIAYILATVKRETGNTFKPVIEAYYISKNFERAERWRKRNLRYYPWHGRGFVQITWEANYKKFKKLTGEDLTGNPDLTLRPDIALFILLYGFQKGTFTGRKLSRYVNKSKTDYYNARRCVNGTDHAREIANDAKDYYQKYFA